MRIGTTLRNMGAESTPKVMGECAHIAESVGLESIWVVDHIAIPPDDAEGSGGRYLDPLASLAWLAGRTERILLGVGVLILPYRPPLPTAKTIATVQELSGERMILGAGVGWMQPEFDALGVDRSRRGRDTDATLAFLNDCFANDEVAANGQPFLFKPRPRKPPILVGGGPPHALERAVRYGDGWLPMAREPAKIAVQTAELQRLAAAAGREPLEVTAMTGLPEDPVAAAERVAAFADAGVDRIVAGGRYGSVAEFAARAEALGALSDS
ncbi:MAG: TIGR03619 family F420-dependent LLM class oxidoreductase [Pseudomonadota bacterium]